MNNSVGRPGIKILSANVPYEGPTVKSVDYSGDSHWVNFRADDDSSLVMTPEQKRAHINNLEKAVERIFVGAFKVEGNTINLKTSVYSDNCEWQYVCKIQYTLNDNERVVEVRLDIHAVDSPTDIVNEVREAVIKDLSDLITRSFIEDNSKTLMNFSHD